MKKSIKLLSILVLVFFITDRLVAFGLKQLDKKVLTGQSVGKVNHFIAKKDSVNLLVFGSSRANHHVDNKLLNSSSFNAGSDGSKIGYSALLISTLKKKNQNIFVHIDHDKIYSSNYEGKDILGLINLINRNDDIRKNISDFFPEEIIISKLFNTYLYNGKVLGMVKNYFVPNYDQNNYTGYDPLYPSEEQKLIFQKLVKENKFPSFKDKEFDLDKPNPLVNDFIDLISNICKQNNSNLIFFTSPNLKLVDDNYRIKTKSYFFSKGLNYYDYSDLIDASDISCWKDFTHLSHKGALKLTNELKKHLAY